jgi:beta-carotene 3-hydroxylase
MLVNAAIVVATVLIMEGVAFAVHKYVMHGPGWGWHRSHHKAHDHVFEANDLYAIVFAALSIVLILFSPARGPLYWVGVGMGVYGVLYFVVHDGLVHQRWPFRHVPRNGYLKRLVQAHRLHHAIEDREGAVSFGFLYAPPVRSLKQQLRSASSPSESVGS